MKKSGKVNFSLTVAVVRFHLKENAELHPAFTSLSR